jgi:hypothetical protein
MSREPGYLNFFGSLKPESCGRCFRNSTYMSSRERSHDGAFALPRCVETIEPSSRDRRYPIFWVRSLDNHSQLLAYVWLVADTLDKIESMVPENPSLQSCSHKATLSVSLTCVSRSCSMSDLITEAGASRVLFVDLHATQIQVPFRSHSPSQWR